MCKNQEFFQLNPEQFANLLKSDDLNVPSEQDVFHALIEWCQYDQTNREKNIPDLLALIRLPLLHPAVNMKLFYFYLAVKSKFVFFFFSLLPIMLKHFVHHQLNVNH